MIEVAILCGSGLVAFLAYLAYAAWHNRELFLVQQRLQDQQAWLTSQSQTVDYCAQLYQLYVSTAHELVKHILQDPNVQILGLPIPLQQAEAAPVSQHEPVEPDPEVDEDEDEDEDDNEPYPIEPQEPEDLP